jgi:hypothetical protein
MSHAQVVGHQKIAHGFACCVLPGQIGHEPVPIGLGVQLSFRLLFIGQQGLTHFEGVSTWVVGDLSAKSALKHAVERAIHVQVDPIIEKVLVMHCQHPPLGIERMRESAAGM